MALIGQEAEADAALLLAVGDEAGEPRRRVARGERRPEDAVGNEREQVGVHLADDGAAFQRQRAAAARVVEGGVGDEGADRWRRRCSR